MVNTLHVVANSLVLLSCFSDSDCGVCLHGYRGLELVNRPRHTKGMYKLPQRTSVKVNVLLKTQSALFLFFPLCSAGLFLFITMESPLLHHQLHHSYSSLLRWDTQTSCGTIDVSFFCCSSYGAVRCKTLSPICTGLVLPWDLLYFCSNGRDLSVNVPHP